MTWLTGTDPRLAGENKASKLGFRVSDNANLLNTDLSSKAKKEKKRFNPD